VSIAGGRYVRANKTFQFYKFETIAVSPLLGPEAGGTLIQVHGTPDAGHYAPYFRFGNSTIAGARNEMGIASCVSPAYSGAPLHACEGYDSSTLEISLNGQQYSPLGDFVYYGRDTPCLENVDPASGPVDGGTTISVALAAPLLRTYSVLAVLGLHRSTRCCADLLIPTGVVFNSWSDMVLSVHAESS
jgi:hypothetical protein